MVVRHVAHQLERPGAGRLLVEVVLGGEVMGNDGGVPRRRDHAQDRGEGLLEAHSHRVAVQRLDVLYGAELLRPGGCELGIEQALEGVDDVLRLELPPVVEHHPLAQGEVDREIVVGDAVVRGQAGEQVALPVEDEKGVVDVAEDEAGRVLCVGARGEVGRLRRERDGEGAAPHRALLVGRSRGERRRRQRDNRQKRQGSAQAYRIRTLALHFVPPRWRTWSPGRMAPRPERGRARPRWCRH